MDAHDTHVDDETYRGGRRRPGHRAAWLAAMNDEEPWRRGRPPFAGRRGRRGWSPDGDTGRSWFGPGPRAARGDVRSAILALLAEQPMHGYQIIRELSERTGGVWSPSPGSVYPTLQHLEDEGLVQADDADGKKVFTLTEAGRAVAANRPDDRPAPWDEVGGEVDAGRVELRDAVMTMAAAVKQVAHTASAAQKAEVVKVLTEARRTIYRILAEDAPEGS